MIRSRKINGSWHHYGRVRHDGRDREWLLGTTARKSPDNSIYMKFGEDLKLWEQGIDPNSARMMIREIPVPVMAERYSQTVTKHLVPFFGTYRVKDIDEAALTAYCVHRWGQTEDGKPRAVKNTWNKERRALKYLVNAVVKGWEPPGIKTHEDRKPTKKPLTLEQVEAVGREVPKKYQAAYWIMAYTGMDVSDALTLAPEHIDWSKGWITKARGKTQCVVSLPICKSLGLVLRSLPRPVQPASPLISSLKSHNCATEIRRAFHRAGLNGYSAKDLRRFIASRLQDAGYSYEWIAKVLGHAPGSQVTQRYAAVYDDTLRAAFDKLEERTG